LEFFKTLIKNNPTGLGAHFMELFTYMELSIFHSYILVWSYGVILIAYLQCATIIYLFFKIEYCSNSNLIIEHFSKTQSATEFNLFIYFVSQPVS